MSRKSSYQTTEEIRAGLAFLDGLITKGNLPAGIVADPKKREDKLERNVGRILGLIYEYFLHDFLTESSLQRGNPFVLIVREYTGPWRLT